MAFYLQITTTRTTSPDPVLMLAAIKAATADPSAVLIMQPGSVCDGKKAAPWTQAHIASAQNILDTTAPVTAQVEAQRKIDSFPIEYVALVLALIDALNVVRAALVPAKAAITPAQAIQAIRDKAGTL